MTAPNTRATDTHNTHNTPLEALHTQRWYAKKEEDNTESHVPAGFVIKQCTTQIFTSKTEKTIRTESALCKEIIKTKKRLRSNI
jgi:hypothetical protein